MNVYIVDIKLKPNGSLTCRVIADGSNEVFSGELEDAVKFIQNNDYNLFGSEDVLTKICKNFLFKKK